ncbi:hypothetical protein [Paenibacillus polymyxa]|uniref:hypothetical protein n=1 Tax=Paenibacillus polymyxa TaxID=1406 RepID=UPI002349FA70|nr:hypothetical protein [Paenibacillus polymyxa]WCM62873.1 hypothetical protein OYT09_08050 [Paenibacillus polymyxa]
MNQKFFIMALIRGFLIGDTFFLIGALALYFTRRYELIKVLLGLSTLNCTDFCQS